jgi:hypothetical protein
MALGLLAIGAVLFARSIEIVDTDELWHLATGKLIVETGSVPARDPFTFTAGDAPWVNTNWLAQVLLYGTWRLGGFEACVLLGFACLAGALALVHVLALRRTGSPISALVAVGFAANVLTTTSTIRPQGWTFLLLAAALVLLWFVRERPKRGWGIALGLVLALSVQLHGGFIFPFGVTGLALVASLVERRTASAWLLVLALAIGFVGFFLHPDGFEALLHPFRYVLDARFRDMNRDVVELRPTDLTDGSGRFLEGTLLVFLVGALVVRPKLRLEEIAAFLLLGHLALTSRRGLHYFGLVAAAPLACTVHAALVLGKERGGLLFGRAVAWLLEQEKHLEPWARFAPLVLLLSVPLAGVAPSEPLAPGKPRSLESKLLAKQQDVAAVGSYLLAKDPPGNVWNAMETGGALLWMLYPDRRVYIDGRGDLHVRSGAWRDMITVLHCEPGWEGVLERNRCDTVVVSRDDLSRRLYRRGWRLAFEAGSLVVMVRPGSGAEKKLLP